VNAVEVTPICNCRESGLRKKFSVENALFLGLILIYLIPIWVVRYFPSTDGPSHMANANILLHYIRSDHGLLHQYYQLNNNLDPNWAGHIVLAGIGFLLPMLIAEKILLSGYIILFPLSVLYAVKSIQHEGEACAFLAFPLIYNYPLHMGFYNFSYSLVLFFFVIGYWMRYKESLSRKRIAILAILLLLLYFCHIVSLVMAGVGIGIMLTLWVFLEVRGRAGHGKAEMPTFLRLLRSHVLPVAYAFLPTVLLAGSFILRRGLGGSTRVATSWTASKKLLHLLSLSSLVSYRNIEIIPSTGFAVLFGIVAGTILYQRIARRSLKSWDILLVVSLAYALIYFVSPNEMSGGSYLSPRLMLFPFFGLILWFGAQSTKIIPKRAVVGAAVGIGFVFLALNSVKYSEIDSYLNEFVSGESHIEPEATLLPLIFSKEGRGPDGKPLSLRISPFLHASGLIVAKNPVVDLDNYEAAKGYFPIVYRNEINPFVHIGHIEADPPRVDFLNYPERTGGRVDYVLLWGLDSPTRRNARVQDILEQLGKGYDLIFVSLSRGLMELYRIKAGTIREGLKTNTQGDGKKE